MESNRTSTPTSEAVRDLLNAVPYLPWVQSSVFRSLRAVLGMVEAADSEAGEKYCLQAVRVEPRLASSSAGHGAIAEALRELCNYRPDARGAILDAAIADVERRENAGAEFRALMPAVDAAIRQLDPRSKALLYVLATLEQADPSCSDFGACWSRAADGAPVDVLRHEPGLAPLMKAFDLVTGMEG